MLLSLHKRYLIDPHSKILEGIPVGFINIPLPFFMAGYISSTYSSRGSSLRKEGLLVPTPRRDSTSLFNLSIILMF